MAGNRRIVAMKITPLQQLLLQRVVPVADILQATGRDRSTVSRWRRGMSFPERQDAEILIALFGAERLDYNGCYEASVEVADAGEATHG